MGAELNIPFSKKIKASVAPEVRFANGESQLDEFLIDANARLRVSRLFEPQLSYRFYRFYDYPGRFFTGNRFSVGIRSSVKIERFRLVNLLRYQHQLINRYDYGYTIEVRRALRERLRLSYNIRRTKLEPYVQAEIAYDFTKGRNYEFYRFRLRAGFDYPIPKRSSLEVFFQLQDKLNTSNPLRTYTLGIYYNFDLVRNI